MSGSFIINKAFDSGVLSSGLINNYQQGSNAGIQGAARRVLIPGTPLAHYGIVSEALMTHILSVVRLAVGSPIPDSCAHEPNVSGSAARANLLWTETGSHLRDIAEDTDKGRGTSVAQCWRCSVRPSGRF